jgi:hypothetical protein
MSNVITPKFRASFAQVFTPQAAKNQDGTPKLKNGQQVQEYSVQALFPKDADLSALKAAAAAAVKEKWGDKPPAKLRSPFRTEKEDGSLPDGLEAGAIFMNFKTVVKPGLVDESNQDIIDPVQFYSGCYARASVRAYAYGGPGTNFTPGVAFGLQNLQKLADGEPLAGVRVKASDEFEPVAGAAKAAAESGAGGLFD